MKVEKLDFQTLTLCKIFTSYAQNLEMSSLLVGKKIRECFGNSSFQIS